MLKIGNAAEKKKQLAKNDVNLFAQLNLDKNPINLDYECAKNSFSNEKIDSGLLSSSLISSGIVNKPSEEGSIYLYQILKFLKPVKINDQIAAKVILTEKNSSKKMFSLETLSSNQKN